MCLIDTSSNGAAGCLSLSQVLRKEHRKVRKKIRTVKGRLLSSPGEVTLAPHPTITLMSRRTIKETAPGKEPRIEDISQVLCSE